MYKSCCWDITIADAEALIGGWIYLNPKKTKPSDFGGRILSFEAGQKWKDKPHRNRIVFLLEGRREARGQLWRGSDYGMAHTGGLVEAALPHELETEMVKSPKGENTPSK
jgi:hypothetical protein